jgi:hypothetical protein
VAESELLSNEKWQKVPCLAATFLPVAVGSCRAAGAAVPSAHLAVASFRAAGVTVRSAHLAVGSFRAAGASVEPAHFAVGSFRTAVVSKRLCSAFRSCRLWGTYRTCQISRRGALETRPAAGPTVSFRVIGAALLVSIAELGTTGRTTTGRRVNTSSAEAHPTETDARSRAPNARAFYILNAPVPANR